VTYLPGVAAPRPTTAARRTSVAFRDSEPSEEDPGDDDADAGARISSRGARIPSEPDEDDAPDRETVIAAASVTLTRSLGRRGLSISEARAKLRSSGLTSEEADVVAHEFIDRGWLDDAVLAEQLVHSATTRQDKGTKAIRQLLQKRMLAREVIDAVIAELPDDDAERALEFARSKARSLRNLDRETALRRLTGQLARRGYGGSVAMTAARTALDENSPGASSGVRFR